MHRPLQPDATAPIEKPQNGIAGLKHWRYDLRSGFMVAMISLPFSMGIAITSGAPPVCGIVSAIIAGFLLPFLGGSYVTISGPAAGLAPAIYAGITWMGSVYLGSNASNEEVMAAGYPLLLVAIAVAGVLQVVLARLKVARLSAIFPAAAIEGMLVAIGLMIIVKQIPLLLGARFEAHEFWDILAEVPSRLSGMNVQVFGLGAACVALLFILSAVPGRLFKMLPPPVWVFLLGTVVSRLFLNLGPENLINVPSAPLANGIVLPKFTTVFGDPGLWLPLGYMVLTLMLIDGTESLATINAVDKLDPFRRRSDPDLTLQAMGVSNVASSMLGGLTIIPGIVKSTANIIGGGRTQWANFYNACFLLFFLVFARTWINMVPTAVLASILVFIGFKLCRPKVWQRVAHVGVEQLVICAVTVAVTVTTDLLIGVFTGMALKLALNVWYTGLIEKLFTASVERGPGVAGRFFNLFRNPVGERAYCDGVYNLFFDRPLVCFNLFHVIRELERIPADAQMTCLHISPRVTLIDHTSSETLSHYMEEHNARPGGSPRLELNGLESMRSLSKHQSGMRLNMTLSAASGERAQEQSAEKNGRDLLPDHASSLRDTRYAPPHASGRTRFMLPGGDGGQATGWQNDTALVSACWQDDRPAAGCAFAFEANAPCCLSTGTQVVRESGGRAAFDSLSPLVVAVGAADARLVLPKEYAMSTPVWCLPTCDDGDAPLPVADTDNDLTWLSLIANGEVRTADGDLCHLILVCENDPDSQSPDPFLSDEAWNRLVAGRCCA
ncbi:MAG TPA: SulP family inorganic anion transporter [Pirellulales bacterium]|nr:SulP family inorganic anion transporter [Pirellulales bacterium]